MINHIFYRFGISDHHWKHLPGVLKNVTVGPMGVFGCNPLDKIFYLNGMNWQPLVGALKCITAGKVTLMMLLIWLQWFRHS